MYWVQFSAWDNHARRQLPEKLVVFVKLNSLIKRLLSVANVGREGETPGFAIEDDGNLRPGGHASLEFHEAGSALGARPFSLFVFLDVVNLR